jgi:tRNA dimethylallyltransferase
LIPASIIITGPTASGKSDLALELAHKIDGEIVCTDSMQVYRGLDIGTAKPTKVEQLAVPHHQIDLCNLDEHYSAGQYARDAEITLNKLGEVGKIPIFVGGSGLYYKALIYGLDEMPPIPKAIRQSVLNDWKIKGFEECYQELAKCDPELAARLSPRDATRVQRGLEIFRATRERMSSFQKSKFGNQTTRFPVMIFGVHWERDALYQRINLRTEAMLKIGWMEEVKALLELYSPSLSPLNGLGYKQIISYLNGEINYNHMVEEIQQKTRNFAKRQLTWFRQEKSLKWFEINKREQVFQATEAFLSAYH